MMNLSLHLYLGLYSTLFLSHVRDRLPERRQVTEGQYVSGTPTMRDMYVS